MGLARPPTTRCVAGPGLTTIPVWLPVIDGVNVSVAVTDRVPAVRRVTPKVPTPPARVASPGRMAAPSLLVKWTVPA
jgi:hypothetical protein